MHREPWPISPTELAAIVASPPAVRSVLTTHREPLVPFATNRKFPSKSQVYCWPEGGEKVSEAPAESVRDAGWNGLVLEPFCTSGPASLSVQPELTTRAAASVADELIVRAAVPPVLGLLPTTSWPAVSEAESTFTVSPATIVTVSVPETGTVPSAQVDPADQFPPPVPLDEMAAIGDP